MDDRLSDRLADSTISGLKGFFTHHVSAGEDPTACMQMFLNFLESNREKNPQFIQKIASRIDSSFIAPLMTVDQIASPDDFIAAYHSLMSRLIEIDPTMSHKTEYEKQKALIANAKDQITERILGEKAQKKRIVNDEYKRILSERKEVYKKTGGGRSLKKRMIVSLLISICLIVPLLLNIVIPPTAAKAKEFSSEDGPAFAPTPLWATSVHFGLERTEAASGLLGYTGIVIWDLVTEDVVKTLPGHDELVDCTAFSPDGTSLASAAYRTPVIIWDLATAEAQKSLTVDSRASPEFLLFSPDGTRLALVTYNRTTIWDLTSEEEALTIPMTQTVLPCFSPDGAKLASGVADTVVIWDLVTGEADMSLDGHSDGSIRSTTFSPDGMRLVAGADDGAITIWDLGTGEVIRSLTVHRSVAYFPLSFNPDGTKLAAAPGSRIILWDLTSGKEQIIERGNGMVVGSLSFSPDGTQLASTSRGQDVVLWDLLRTESFIPFLPYELFYVVLLFGIIGIISLVIRKCRVNAIRLTPEEKSAYDTSLANIEEHFSDKEQYEISESTLRILAGNNE